MQAPDLNHPGWAGVVLISRVAVCRMVLVSFRDCRNPSWHQHLVLALRRVVSC